ncbi:hypothetical protein BMB171_C4614 [Bacillus thuringiensis BMB171]|nr:hypothetical protein BMB171_C4614 [Bacillus thuringiensis BMB171]
MPRSLPKNIALFFAHIMLFILLVITLASFFNTLVMWTCVSSYTSCTNSSL